MELRHLRYFIAVAEAGSFRVAAERIHITQPAITRQIHDMEEEIGAVLFHRTSQGITLTPAGTLFLRDGRSMLSMLEATIRSAKQLADGLQGSLRISFVENLGWDGQVPDAFALFQEQVPNLQLQLLPQNSPDQVTALQENRIDGGFIYKFDQLPNDIGVVDLTPRRAILAVPRHWQWSSEHPIHARALSGQPMICFPRHTYPAYHDHLIETCHRAGLTLNIVQEVTTEAAILSLVSTGIGAAIVNSGNGSRPPARTQFIEFADLDIPLPLAFIYRQSHDNPALSRFIALLGKLNDVTPPVS